MKLHDWLQIILLSLLFGSSFFFTEIAGASVGPLTIAASRLAIAGIVLAIVGGFGSTDNRVTTPVTTLVLLGLMNSFLPISLIAWAQQSLPSGVSSILAATSPVFGMFFAHALLQHEPINLSRVAATLVAFVGVVLVLDPTSAYGLSLGMPPAAVLLAAATSAFAGVLGRKLVVPGTRPLDVAKGQVISAAAMATAAAVILELPWSRPFPPLEAVTSLVIMGLVSTALAYVLFFRLLERVGAANTLLVGFLVPASATILGAGFLGERLNAVQIGGFLLLSGALLAIGRPRPVPAPPTERR